MAELQTLMIITVHSMHKNNLSVLFSIATQSLSTFLHMFDDDNLMTVLKGSNLIFSFVLKYCTSYWLFKVYSPKFTVTQISPKYLYNCSKLF